jgi:hypothetical protein
VAGEEKVEIGAWKSIKLSYDEFARLDVRIINRSGTPINVAVINPETNRQVQGFGLGPIANEIVSVNEGHLLVLKNTSAKDISVTIEFVERKPDTYNPENAKMISFTLHNSSLKSIPLIIPDVMNPNLSPVSNSGVTLKMGQKIYYNKNGLRKLLLTVDESIQPGDKIDVAKLVARLKRE